jgi:hypothetical protein
MDKQKTKYEKSRRQFMLEALPLGTFLCLAMGSVSPAQSKHTQEEKPKEHKFLADSEMTFTDVFRFAFRGYYIPCLKGLAKEMGKDKFIEMLKKAASESVAQRQREWVKTLPKNDFAAFLSISESSPNRFVKHVLTRQELEKSDKFVRTKITECLWAKIFQDSDAADIGYAGICYPDFAMTSAFNQKIKLIRPKTLMQGHDCCDFQYYWEG